MSVTSTVFSEYEVRQIAVKIENADSADVTGCVGSAEEEMEVKTVTKNCRGVVAKTRTKGTGAGSVKLSLHVKQDLFAKLYGMESDDLADGVIAYGNESLHPKFCLTMKVLDEDDNVKYKAYPSCTVSTGVTRSVENGADEVAEVEMEIAVMPDDYGMGVYEALASDIDETIAASWMESFTPDLVQATTA